jgi:hypothetical protein
MYIIYRAHVYASPECASAELNRRVKLLSRHDCLQKLLVRQRRGTISVTNTPLTNFPSMSVQ